LVPLRQSVLWPILSSGDVVKVLQGRWYSNYGHALRATRSIAREHPRRCIVASCMSSRTHGPSSANRKTGIPASFTLRICLCEPTVSAEGIPQTLIPASVRDETLQTQWLAFSRLYTGTATTSRPAAGTDQETVALSAGTIPSWLSSSPVLSRQNCECDRLMCCTIRSGSMLILCSAGYSRPQRTASGTG
jgi:hypothetical protein